MAYDYRQAVLEDVREWVRENPEITEECETFNELVDKLNDTLWVEDSVTGNASGSYTFNSYQAQENLIGNEDLVKEMAEMFGCEDQVKEWLYDGNYESIDVSIRCYLLGDACYAVASEVFEEE